jgi:cytochrome c5
MKKLTMLAVIVVLSACSSKLLMPTQADAERGAAMYQGLTLNELKEGRQLYEANCNLCHPVKNPSNWTAEQWHEIMPKMLRGVEKKGKTMTEEERESILRYAVTMAKKA